MVNVFRFTMTHGADLHLVDAGHQPLKKVAFVEKTFAQFLDGLG